jgi:hypothetical protein
MRILVLLVLFSSSATVFSQITKNVLFIGNSYTYYNNMPMMLSQMANSTGDNINTDSSAPGGYTLNGHTTNATTLQKIQAGGWDFVVLQEQSQFPSFPIGQVQTDCFPYAAQLDSMINAIDSCTETMFYMTWGRENGDASNCAGWPPVCTYEGMDDLLRERYNQMAVDNHGVLSPVGSLRRYIRNNNPTLQLYATDGSHPSLEGSYAAACSFYSTILRKDPTLIVDDQGLSPADALFIRNAAKAVVYDSLMTWHIGEYDPVASFSNVVSFYSVAFINASTSAMNFEWNFGDGGTSTSPNPSHTYGSIGTYTVQLIADNCGISDTFMMNVIIATSTLNENKLVELKISPNPVNDILSISIDTANNIELKDEFGRLIPVTLTKTENGYSMNMSTLKSGLYFVQLEKDGRIFSAKVFKQ